MLIHLQETVNTGFFHMRSTCRRCGGQGSILSTPCKKCRGKGKVNETKTITIPIPAGTVHSFINPFTPKSATFCKFKTEGKISKFILQNCQNEQHHLQVLLNICHLTQGLTLEVKGLKLLFQEAE